jgi:hypothetical protein
MSMIKKTYAHLGTGPASIAIGLTLFVTGCTGEPADRTATQSHSVGERRADDPKASPVTPDEVLEPREGSKFDMGDYVATEGPFRLFGIENGDGTRARTAIIADAKGWSARAYAEGQSVGRGMKVAKIEDGKVTLRGAHGDLVLGASANVKLRVVRHRLDVVARPLGKHHYALDTAAARATKTVLPSFESAELYGGQVLKLGPIEPGSLLAEVDLREGDLLTVPEGTASGEAALDEIKSALTDGRPQVVIHLVRGGIPTERTYTTITE